jgi:hypothetical protein
LSPTLFAIFINDLATETKNSGVGVPINIDETESNDENALLNILLYADDIVLFAANEQDLQFMLNLLKFGAQSSDWR